MRWLPPLRGSAAPAWTRARAPPPARARGGCSGGGKGSLLLLVGVGCRLCSRPRCHRHRCSAASSAAAATRRQDPPRCRSRRLRHHHAGRKLLLRHHHHRFVVVVVCCSACLLASPGTEIKPPQSQNKMQGKRKRVAAILAESLVMVGPSQECEKNTKPLGASTDVCVCRGERGRVTTQRGQACAPRRVRVGNARASKQTERWTPNPIHPNAI
jgi:hypothetical protein